MKLGVARYAHLIDVKHIPDLAGITVADGTLRIGAAVTHWDLERDATIARVLPAFAELERNVANVRVRAAGTLAGNLAFAEPHADPPAFLIALGARIVVAGGAGRRAVSVDDFVTGMYQTALGPDEVIVAIEVPVPPADARAAYVKLHILERPAIGVAVSGVLRGGRFPEAPEVVVGAVDERPRRVDAAALANAAATDTAAADELARVARAAVAPIPDLAGEVDYKRHL